MRFPSLLKNLVRNGDDTSDYWAFVDRIGSVIRSAPDLDCALNQVATSLGRALEASRSAVVILDGDSKSSSDYCAQPIGMSLRERFAALDQGIALKLSEGNQTIESRADSDSSLRDLINPALVQSKNHTIKSFIVAPFLLDSKTIGAIII